MITLGEPDTLTGGYLYHRRMAEAAPAWGVELSFVSFPQRRFPLAALSGPAVVRGVGRADAVILDSIAACFAAPWLGRLPAHIPVVGMLHQPPGGIDYGGVRRWISAWLDLHAYRRVNPIMVASETLKVEMIAAGISEEKIVVVAPGRNVAESGGRSVGNLRQGRLVAVLCVANWVERKGILDALDAVALLPEGLMTLHFVGDERLQDPYGRTVDARIRRSDLMHRVVRHGPIPKEDVAAMYRAADVFLLPSFVEPYGTVYGEAMAEGLPVVGYDAGNLPHLATHGTEGLLAAPGDVQGLARLLREVVEDDDMRLALAGAARERAASLPAWDDTARLFFDTVKSRLGGTGDTPT